MFIKPLTFFGSSFVLGLLIAIMCFNPKIFADSRTSKESSKKGRVKEAL